MGDRYSLAADDCGKRCSSLSLQSLIALSVGPLVPGKSLQYRSRIIKHARQTRYSVGICGAPNAWDTAQLRTCIINSHPRQCSFPRGLHLHSRWQRIPRLHFKTRSLDFQAYFFAFAFGFSFVGGALAAAALVAGAAGGGCSGVSCRTSTSKASTGPAPPWTCRTIVFHPH